LTTRWADLPVAPVGLDGWDNTTHRLGDEMSVRLPGGDEYSAQVDKEQAWLPVLAPQSPLPIPRPLARGAPSEHFPRPWSVYRWLDGEPASTAPITDLGRLATDLAAFLSALYRIDGAGGPAAGPHSHFRGGPLRTWDAVTRAAIEALDGRVAAHAVTTLWESALKSELDGAATCVHGDVVGSNLLVVDGVLAAVIDFGCCAVGDPACDLAIAWTFFAGESRRAFRDALDFDDAAWERGRGWALWKALIELCADGEEAHDGRAGPPGWRRMGWRTDAAALVEDLVAQPWD
jgi:aminoglycoside phosphotransferase (APT) family kinase protein